MCRIKYKRIAYFSKDAVRLMSEGDKELQEFYMEVYLQNVLYMDVYFLFDFDFNWHLTQLVESLPFKRVVRGSSPWVSTNFIPP